MSLQGDCVKGYIKKYPDMPTLTLAKFIYGENNALFSSTEHARSIIRYHVGQSGRKKREAVADKAMFKPPGKKNPFAEIPVGMKDLGEWEPVHIKEQKTLVIADVHAPYHEREPLLTALEYGYKNGIDGLLILGDMMDFFSLSFWEKDPRKRDFPMELEICRGILKTISDGFPGVKKRYKIGNHEERYERYLQVKAPELLGVDYLEFSKLTHCEKYDFEVIGDRKIVKIATLNLVHGHEFGRSVFSPVNPARGLFMRGKAHCLGGHHHQPSHHPEPDMNGKIIGCWSIGCLCDLHPQYLPINKWQHGFGIVERLGDDEFLVSNKTIIKGKVY